MARTRIIVGSTGTDEAARVHARQLRDQGQEAVFVGGGQSPEQLLSTAVAEDASQIVVDGDDAAIERLRALCVALGTEAPAVHALQASGCDVTNAPESADAV